MDQSSEVPCKAKIAISDIRIPLMWRDSDRQRGGDSRRQYAVFCMLTIGTEIYDTVLLKDVDSSMMDLCFDDIVVL